jgi:hypothetical protein
MVMADHNTPWQGVDGLVLGEGGGMGCDSRR